MINTERPLIGFKRNADRRNKPNSKTLELLSSPYMTALYKAFSNFLEEEVEGNLFNEERFVCQIKAIRQLYHKERQYLIDNHKEEG